MAVKAIAQIRNFDWDTNEGLNFQLRIFSIDPAMSIDNHWTGYLGIGESDSASVINTTLMAYIKQYAIDTWQTEFGELDTVRILAAVDSIL